MRTSFLHFSTLACAFLIAGLPSCLPNGPGNTLGGQSLTRQDLRDRMRAKPEHSVLFIGNSYSFGVPGDFKKLAAKRGYPVKVSQLTHNGWSLGRHAADVNTLREIREHRWDVIILQELSRTPSIQFQRRLRMFPAVCALAAEARHQGAIPVLYQTWGYREGDPQRARDDFPAMNNRVRQGYAAAAKHAGGIPIIPVGDAWESEFSAGRCESLYMPDGSHPTPRGNHLAAETFFFAMFGTN